MSDAYMRRTGYVRCAQCNQWINLSDSPHAVIVDAETNEREHIHYYACLDIRSRMREFTVLDFCRRGANR